MEKDQVREYIDEALSVGAETALVEFKDARKGFPKEPVARTLSAFGNVQGGGVIVFGIEEDKEDRKLNAVGLKNLSDIQEKMSQLVSEEMNVILRLDYHTLRIHGEHVLGVFVPECRNSDKPYYHKRHGLPRGAYVREGNTDRQMTEYEMREYIRNAQGDEFDASLVEDLNPDDLDEVKIRGFFDKSAGKTRRDVGDVEDYLKVMQNIGIIGEGEGGLVPTFAGYLIFSDGEPQQKLQFERYTVRCVRYKGSGVQSDIVDSADVGGTLDEQIDGMMTFILRNIQKRAHIEGTKRIEKYEYPEKAIREIVANAIIHRDYRITETYVQVNIFDDRIEVFNPGNLPPGVTVENIRDAQMSRNKIIAARLKDLDYLEEYGRGINIVFSEMSKWGLLAPLFKNTANSFRVILPGEKLSQLNNRQLKIWERLVDAGQITRKEIENVLPNTPVQTISNDLSKMKKMGLIEQRGESVRTYYEAKF